MSVRSCEQLLGVIRVVSSIGLYARLLARSSSPPSPHGPLLGRAVSDRLVVAIVVVAGPDSLPAPRCRLPTPARAAVEADACDEGRRGKGEEAAIMESVETSERKPVDARCKSGPEGEAAGADESTAESCAAESSAYRRAADPAAYWRTAEPSAYCCAAEPATYRRAAEPSAYRRATESAAHHSAAKATTHPAVKAPSVEATTSTHPGIGCR